MGSNTAITRNRNKNKDWIQACQGTDYIPTFFSVRILVTVCPLGEHHSTNSSPHLNQ